MARRRNVVRLGLPALIVAALALIALWRVGPPPETTAPVVPTGATGGTAAGSAPPAPPAGPLTRVAETLAENSVGREASLEGIEVRQLTSARTFWAGAIDEMPVFVVLDPDVKRPPDVKIAPGLRLTLIGLVRPMPAVADAQRQWALDPATAKALADVGTYLHVTEIRHIPDPKSQIPDPK